LGWLAAACPFSRVLLGLSALLCVAFNVPSIARYLDGIRETKMAVDTDKEFPIAAPDQQDGEQQQQPQPPPKKPYLYGWQLYLVQFRYASGFVC
jgi:hypothetical protein